MDKLKLIILLGIAMAASTLCLNAQNQSDMRLNELLIYNETNFEDDFGFHHGWFELFNTSYGTVDIGGCFLTNDPENLKKYIIPKADVQTKIPPRQHTLFWADNNPYHGTFHINFTLEESDTIYFVASDGRTVIDKIAVPKNLGVDQSYGRLVDGIGSTDGSGEGWAILERTSPSTNNSGVDDETKSQKMKETDPYGWIMTVTAMSVVFIALIVLCLIFKLTGHTAVKNQNKRSTKSTEGTGITPVSIKDTSSETFAAIALALHLYVEENEAHDTESLTITMSHTDRTYSPWSSKIYSLRQTPTVKKNQR